MRIIILLLAIIALANLANEVSAQNTPQPLTLRRISGIVQDSTGEAISGAMITLTSKADTLKTSTDDEGVFSFRDVKSWEFTLTVSALGYRRYVKVGRYNDATAHLMMDPVILKAESHALSEVTVSGAPLIIYKTDTVEYRASDYVVREGSSVAELLKKMDGMEVGRDGSLSYNGVSVSRARLNGKDFMEGSVAPVIQTLPADIVDKIQIVDDYGDQAARTGIKNGDPSKLLNITTRADRSMGLLAKINAGAGNSRRYDGGLTGIRIDANRNTTLSGTINNTLNGVAGPVFGIQDGSTGPAGSGGILNKKTAGFTYRNDLSNSTQINMNYGYASARSTLISLSSAQDFSTNGTTLSSNQGNNESNSGTHNLKMEIETQPDSVNYIKITPSVSYSSSDHQDISSALLSGLIRQDQDRTGLGAGKTPGYGLTALYQHFFPRKGRNYSLQLSGSQNNSRNENEQRTEIAYYNAITDLLLKDSLVHQALDRDNRVNTYRGSFTYSEPFKNGSNLYLTADMNYTATNSGAWTSNLTAGGSRSVIDSLSRVFSYALTQSRMSMQYNMLRQGKYSLSFGMSGILSTLSGTNTSLNAGVQRRNFNAVPSLRFQYSWTPQRQFSVNYGGAVIQPLFDQLQPVRDVSNPQNPVIGNPNLKTSLLHSLYGNYSSYSGYAKFGMNANFNISFQDNPVVAHIVQVHDSYNSLKLERHYLNLGENYRMRGGYRFTKGLPAHGYALTLSGTAAYQQNAGMSNMIRTTARQLTLIEKLALRISPNEKFEINPSVSYTYNRMTNSLLPASNNKTNILSLQAEGKTWLMKSWGIGYDIGKHFVRGINSNLAGNNVFLVNAYLEKQFFKGNAGSLKFQAFDLLNQNRIISRSMTETSITDIRSNALSRYFMVNMSLNLQRWKGTPSRNGQELKRRGDGSFIH